MKRERVFQLFFCVNAWHLDAESMGVAHNKLNTYLYKCI